MSVLNDFFLATDDELAAIDVSAGPASPTVGAPGILDVEWATLEAILHDEPLDDDDAIVDLIGEPVAQEPQDDPVAYVVAVNDRLADAIAAADDQRLRGAVARWLGTDEMVDAGWSEDEAIGLLRELRELFARGGAESRRAYRWVSL